MITPEQKQDWREKYLERLRKQSEVIDFLPLLKAIGTDSFEDHVVGFRPLRRNPLQDTL